MDKNKTKNEKDSEKNKEQTKDHKDIRIEELELQVKELDSKWKRALADYQNHEKWVREQRSDWIKSANKDLLLRILPVLDTLLLAVNHSDDKSLKVSTDQFLSVLNEEGIIKIETIGQDFDPTLMEAISTTEGEENKVIKELRAGYMLYDKVLRAAQVVVGNGEIKN